jgi:hypothetical protein
MGRHVAGHPKVGGELGGGGATGDVAPHDRAAGYRWPCSTLARGGRHDVGVRVADEGATVCQRTTTLKTQFARVALSL